VIVLSSYYTCNHTALFSVLINKEDWYYYYYNNWHSTNSRSIHTAKQQI